MVSEHNVSTLNIDRLNYLRTDIGGCSVDCAKPVFR